MDQDLAVEFMPETQSTVLHYSCIHQNYEVRIDKDATILFLNLL